MSKYTTINQVEAALNNSCEIDSETNPDNSMVHQWIREESGWVDNITRNEYKEETVEELFDYNRQDFLTMSHAPIDNVTVDLNENNVGKQPSWTTLTEWEDYDVDKDKGKVHLIKSSINPRVQRNKFRVEYDKGYQPDWLSGIVARRVAKRVLEAVFNAKAESGTWRVDVGDIRVSDARDLGIGLYENLQKQIKEDEEKLKKHTGVARYGKL